MVYELIGTFRYSLFEGEQIAWEKPLRKFMTSVVVERQHIRHFGVTLFSSLLGVVYILLSYIPSLLIILREFIDVLFLKFSTKMSLLHGSFSRVLHSPMRKTMHSNAL